MAVTNLFTNPRLKGDGTWAEVRRNLVTSAPGAILATRTDNVPFDGDYWYQFQGEGTRGGSRTLIPLESLENGTTYTGSAEVANPGSEPIEILIQWCDGAPGLYTLEPGERKVIHVSNSRAEYTNTYRFVDIRPRFIDDGLFLLRTVTVEKGDAYSRPFDGSTTPETAGDTVQPEDFRWRWLGTPNASESVMEIERVRGLTAASSVTGVSTRDGKPAVRIIPSSDSASNSYAAITIPAGAVRESGVVMGTIHLDAPQTGTLSAYPRRIWVDSPTRFSPLPPNEAGTYPLTLKYADPVMSPHRVYLFHGGRRGSGDVWWTDIGLFAGEYNGPYFDGSMRGYYWAGEPDNSVSIKAPRPNPDHRRKMYFGTRDRMTWVPCPQVERPSTAVGYAESMTYLNGGAFVRRSKGSHRTHEMAWNMISANEAGIIEAIASGAYGDGPLYWVDPMASMSNLLPAMWAHPALAVKSGIELAPTATQGVAPVPTGHESVPSEAATFQFSASNQVSPTKLWIPIPEGQALYLGGYGSSTGSAGLYVTPFSRSGTASTRRKVDLQSLDSLQWFTHWVNGFEFGGVELDFGSGSGTAGVATIAGLRAEMHPLGVDPESQGWTGGMGTSGSDFAAHPERVDYSSVFDKVGITATLVEVGSWL